MEMLLSITKLQNLKAIHNFSFANIMPCLVVINHKTTKFESNSQPWAGACKGAVCCYQSQNYKIWKQFTTQGVKSNTPDMLLSITKLQNLKAIHNLCTSAHCSFVVVINHKTTKFESNSQRLWLTLRFCCSCYQSQNYKIWKQFTTIAVKWDRY